MARYSVAFQKVTGAAAGIICDFRTPAAADMRIFEIGVSAETAVSGTIGLVRATGAGTTPGADQVAVGEDPQTATVTQHVYTTYATEPTQATVYLRRFVLPATTGAGVIWTFPVGIVVPAASGLLLRQLSALAVTYSVYATFDG
jgi:hypothetical protein